MNTNSANATLKQRVQMSWYRLLDANTSSITGASNPSINRSRTLTRDWDMGRRAAGQSSSDRLNHLARQCWNSLQAFEAPIAQNRVLRGAAVRSITPTK